ICQGDSVTFLLDAAPAGYTIQWFKDGQAIVGASAEMLAVTTSGDYQAAYQGVCSIPLSTSRSVTVNDSLPTPLLSTGDTLNFCQGDQIALMSPMAPQNYIYQWYQDGLPLSNDTLQSLDVISSGAYSVQLVGLCTSPISAPQIVAKRALPTPEITVDSVTMELVASGALTYQWLLFGEIIPGETNQTLAVSSPGFYSVRVVDIYGCEGTSSFYVVPVSIEATWLENGGFELVPNPARDHMNVQLNLLKATHLRIQLMDLQGRILAAQDLSAQIGAMEVSFETAALTPGVYTVQVVGKEFQHSEPLVIIR
ncbi:MAG: T9SS type A sorting domain-containing protein, partial [Bacteroidota bacterium]